MSILEILKKMQPFDKVEHFKEVALAENPILIAITYS